MASYNELNALIDAYINRNGVQAITGQILNGVLRAIVDQIGRGYAVMGVATPDTNPGTPDAPESWFAYEPGTYSNFDDVTVAPAEFALLSFVPSSGVWSKSTLYGGFTNVTADIDNNVGTPEVSVAYEDGTLSFDFRNVKGNPGEPGAPGAPGPAGQDGQDGAAAGFGTPTASVDANIGTPSVEVSASGPDTAKVFSFAFHNLKGEQGEQGGQGDPGEPGEQGPAGPAGVTSAAVTVDNTTGLPTATVSLINGVLTLAFSGLKGAQGDTGSSVDYPFTIVNNLTTDDATQALSAAQGVVLDGKVSQLEAEQSKIFPTGAKQLLIDLLKKVAYIDNDVEDDVEDLEYLLLGNAELVSISAVFTPGTEKFYPGQSLDVLKPYLEVTGHYDDSSEREISNYTLSGTLTTGTSTITVTYGEKTTTFNVTVEDVVYYRDGGLIQTRCSLRSAYTNSTKSRAATIDGTTYWFTQAYPAIDGAKSRGCYYLFDLILTAGETYHFDMYYTGLPQGGHLTAQLHGYDETFRVAGVANQEQTSADYSSNFYTSDWINDISGDGQKMSFEVAIPAGSVGARIQLIYKNSSDVETIWPEDFVFTKLVINEVTSE